MSERGVFAVDRGLFDHPIFADEPFTEREAWTWMIGEAAWKARTRRIAKFIIDLERGQLAASVRGMAEKWKWHRSKVERFLKKLKTETMIETANEHGISVITICKYNQYQRVSMPIETPIETPKRDSSETIEKTLKPLEGGGGRRAPPITTPLVAPGPRMPEAAALADKIAVLCFGDVNNVPMSWCGAAKRILDIWFPQGWTEDLVLPIIRETLVNKRDGPPSTISYFEKPILRSLQRASQPLPKLPENQYEAQNGKRTYPARKLDGFDKIDLGIANHFRSARGGGVGGPLVKQQSPQLVPFLCERKG